jgi:site-specific recombinase XerD
MIRELPKKSFEWIISEDKVLLEEEIKSLRNTCQKSKQKGIGEKKFHLVRDWFMVELGLLTGLRVEEMTDLQIKDILIDSQHSSVIVRHGKGGRKRTVWVNAGI